MPSPNEIEAAQATIDRHRATVRAAIGPELDALTSRVKSLADRASAHETADEQRHTQVMARLGDIDRRLDWIKPPGDPGPFAPPRQVEPRPSTWAPVAGALAGAIERVSGWSPAVWVMLVAIIVGGSQVAHAVAVRAIDAVIGPAVVPVQIEVAEPGEVPAGEIEDTWGDSPLVD